MLFPYIQANIKMLFPFGIIENIYPRSGKDPVLFQ